MSYKRLDSEDITISAESVVAPVWTGDIVNLETTFTSSTQVASNTGNYFYEIYHQDPEGTITTNTSEVQFAIAFADKQGRGTPQFNTDVAEKSPSSVIYGQYRNLVFGDEDTEFTFGGKESNYFYVINVDRARYKEKLFPGSFNLTLTKGTSELELTDNSREVDTISFADAGRVFEIVSGSNGKPHSGNGFANDDVGSYGKFLPDVGIIILNGRALDLQGPEGIDLNTGLNNNSNDGNLDKFNLAINTGESFQLQSEETVTSNFVFIRVRNSEFNYSTNPSNITGSGELTHDVMVNSPQSYITSVGLYNDNNDLVAVAKLSRPLLKDFTKEALIRIKLDY